MLKPGEIDALIDRVVSRLQARKILVFGSYAKGRATARSDLDLFVVADTELPPARRADSVRPVLAGLLVSVDVHVYTPEEVAVYADEPFSFVRSVLRTGRTVYEDGVRVPFGTPAG